MKNVFTPRMKVNGSEQRVTMHLSDEDYRKIGRGWHWTATVTDLDTGKKVIARGASCGLPHCYCDATAKIKE